MPIINHTAELTRHKYTSRLNNKTDNAFRVISDHIRALTLAITDGAIPSNKGRGYVIRRILRRAARFASILGMHEPFLYKLVPVVTDSLGDAFGEIKERAQYVSTVIEAEEESFGRTLDRGIKIFNTAADRTEQTDKKTISGEDAFQLYDTYGFPLDLTQLMATERGLKVDTEKFEELMNEQRRQAELAQKDASLMLTLADTELPITEDLHKYQLFPLLGHDVDLPLPTAEVCFLNMVTTLGIQRQLRGAHTFNMSGISTTGDYRTISAYAFTIIKMDV